MIIISDQLFTVFVVSNYIQFFLLNFVQYYFSQIIKIRHIKIDRKKGIAVYLGSYRPQYRYRKGVCHLDYISSFLPTDSIAYTF